LSAPRIVVVGGGVAGLAAAVELVRAAPHAEVLLVEESLRVGGLIDSERTRDGFVIEHGADALLTAKPWGVRVASRTDFGDVLVTGGPAPRRSYVSTPSGLVVLPPVFAGASATTVLALAASPLLTVRGKLRLALEPLIPARRDPDDESVRAFVARRFGAELADRVIEPLVGGIHGHDTDRLSALACLPRLRALEQEHGSVTLAMRRLLRERRRHGPHALPATVTFRRGMASLPEALHRTLGDRVRFGTTVRQVRRDAGHGFVLDTTHGALSCEGVVLATPAWCTAGLLEELAPDLAGLLGGVRHKALACVTLAFARCDVPRPLDGTGWVRGADDPRTTLACTWSSAKWWERAPRGHVLLRSILPPDGTPADLVQAARADLRDLLGIRAEPCLTRVRQLARATPIYPVGHGARMAAAHDAAASLGALALAGNAYGGVGVPDCGTSGEAAAGAVLGALTRAGRLAVGAASHARAAGSGAREEAAAPRPVAASDLARARLDPVAR
jgi:oxygen-dependent protoporphyrinogen oxidase